MEIKPIKNKDGKPMTNAEIFSVLGEFVDYCENSENVNDKILLGKVTNNEKEIIEYIKFINDEKDEVKKADLIRKTMIGLK